MITPDELKNEDNLSQCECGNYAHHEYMLTNDDGQNTCPACQNEWITDILSMYKRLLLELADPQLKKKDIDARVKKELCDMMGIDEEYFPEEMAEYYLYEDVQP